MLKKLSSLVAGASSGDTLTGILQFAQPKVAELLAQFNRPLAEGGILEEGEQKCMIVIDNSPEGELKFILQTMTVNEEKQLVIKRFINMADLMPKNNG